MFLSRGRRTVIVETDLVKRILAKEFLVRVAKARPVTSKPLERVVKVVVAPIQIENVIQAGERHARRNSTRGNPDSATQSRGDLVKKRTLFILFTCAHVVLTISTMLYAMTADSARFDNPDQPRAFGAGAAHAAANVLMLPGRLVWTSWASKNLPNSIEWLVLMGNSVVWAAATVGVTTWIFGHRHRRSPARRNS